MLALQIEAAAKIYYSYINNRSSRTSQSSSNVELESEGGTACSSVGLEHSEDMEATLTN